MHLWKFVSVEFIGVSRVSYVAAPTYWIKYTVLFMFTTWQYVIGVGLLMYVYLKTELFLRHLSW